ncbi:TetR/AcrR family transcriptional regulator [Plantactinospora sp. GCM10030261]|uniref:TetR/AcrR family transcriptional regulator n=1 Tax=Plantactinospora sp. GCM10030261 TaxID=3273420 RepID=UPI0036106508
MVHTQERGPRARTRQAIIDAAITVLGQQPAASLGDIAAAADVGRTTLHRYFAERSDLLGAVKAEAIARLTRATELARLDEGTGAAALLRLSAEYFDLGDLLSLLFGEAQPMSEADWAEATGCDRGVAAVVARGHRDGTIDPDLPADWVESLLWSQLYAAWSYLAVSGASRHAVLRLLTRSLGGAVTPGAQ